MPARIRTTVVEVRPGEGGADAEDFAAELTAAVVAWLRRTGYEAEERLSGARTAVVATDALPVDLETVAGPHRVQRVPRTDGRGRRHTSTATVSVLDGSRPQQTNAEPADVAVSFYRSSGPGGQHRNKTETAVRLVHSPTGTVVTCADERSREANLRRARADLDARLAAASAAAHARRQNAARRAQAGSGREAKRFTHNAQRDETVDHRTGRRWRMSAFMKGRID